MTAESDPERQPLGRMLVELSRDKCLELLASHRFGRVAVEGATGVPVIRPVNYVFDERSQSVVFQTAPGSKFDSLVKAARAAFEIDGLEESSRTGWSVIVSGITEEVTDPIDIRRLDNAGLDSWTPGVKAHWMRIRARTVSGRRITAGGERRD